MRAADLAEPYPLVDATAPALDAARLIARDRIPGVVVTDPSGLPLAVLPASAVVRFIVPDYVQDDPALAGVLGEAPDREIAQRLRTATVAELLPKVPPEMAVAHEDDTIVEVAAMMARLRSPLCVVADDERVLGVITAARLLGLFCGDDER